MGDWVMPGLSNSLIGKESTVIPEFHCKVNALFHKNNYTIKKLIKSKQNIYALKQNHNAYYCVSQIESNNNKK